MRYLLNKETRLQSQPSLSQIFSINRKLRKNIADRETEKSVGCQSKQFHVWEESKHASHFHAQKLRVPRGADQIILLNYLIL
jgi:hypothetical protein